MAEDLEIIILSSDDESPKASVKVPSQKHSKNEPVTVTGNIIRQVKLLCNQSQPRSVSQMKTANSVKQQCVSAQNRKIVNVIPANKRQNIVQRKPQHSILTSHAKSVANLSGHNARQIESSKLFSIKDLQNKKPSFQIANKNVSIVALQFNPKVSPKKIVSPSSFTPVRGSLSTGSGNRKNQVSKTDTSVPVSVLNSLQKNGISVSSLQKNGIVVMNVDDDTEGRSVIPSQQSIKPSHTPQISAKQPSINNLKQVPESRNITKTFNYAKSNSLCQAKRKNPYPEGTPSKVLCAKKSSIASESISPVLKNNPSKQSPMVKPIAKPQNFSNVHNSKFSNTTTQKVQFSNILPQNKYKVLPQNKYIAHSQSNSNVQLQNIYKTQVQNVQKVQPKNSTSSHFLNKNYNQTQKNNIIYSTRKNPIQCQSKIQFQSNNKAQIYCKEKIQKSPEYILPDKVFHKTSPRTINSVPSPIKRNLTNRLVVSSQNKSFNENLKKNISQSCDQPKSLCSSLTVKKNDAKENFSKNTKNENNANSNATPFFNSSLSVTVINSDKKSQPTENISKPVAVPPSLVEKKPSLVKNSKEIIATPAVQVSKTVCKKIDLASDRKTLLSVLAQCEPDNKKQLQSEKSKENNDSTDPKKPVMAPCELGGNKQLLVEKSNENNDTTDSKKPDLAPSKPFGNKQMHLEKPKENEATDCKKTNLAPCKLSGNKQLQLEKSEANNDTIDSKKPIAATCKLVGNKQVSLEKSKESNDANDTKKSKLNDFTKVLEPLVISLDCDDGALKPLPEKEIDIFSKKTIKLKDVSNLMKNWSNPVVLLNRIDLDEEYLKVKTSPFKVQTEKSVQNTRKPKNKLLNKKSAEKAVTLVDPEFSKGSHIKRNTCKFSVNKCADDTIKDVSSTYTCVKNSNTSENDNIPQKVKSLNASSTNNLVKIKNLYPKPNDEALKVCNELTCGVPGNASGDIDNEIESKVLGENHMGMLENSDKGSLCSSLTVKKNDAEENFSKNTKNENNANSNATPFFNSSLSVTVINSDKKSQPTENISKPVAVPPSLVEKKPSLVKNSKELTATPAVQVSKTVCKKIDLASDRKTLLSVLAQCEPDNKKQLQPEKSKENNDSTDPKKPVMAPYELRNFDKMKSEKDFVISVKTPLQSVLPEEIDNEMGNKMSGKNHMDMLENSCNGQSNFDKTKSEKDLDISVKTVLQSFLPGEIDNEMENKMLGENHMDMLENSSNGESNFAEMKSEKDLVISIKTPLQSLPEKVENKLLGDNQMDMLENSSNFDKMKSEKHLDISVKTVESFLPGEEVDHVLENEAETEISIPKYEFDMGNNFDISESASVKILLHNIMLKAENLSENEYDKNSSKPNEVVLPCTKDCVVLLDKMDFDDFIVKSKNQLIIPGRDSPGFYLSGSPSEKQNIDQVSSLQNSSKLASVDRFSSEISEKSIDVDKTQETNSLQNDCKQELSSENIETNSNKHLNAGRLLLNSLDVVPEKIDNISKNIVVPKESITIPPFNLSLMEISNNPSDFVIRNCLSQILREVDSLCARTEPAPQNVDIDEGNTNLSPLLVDGSNLSFKVASQTDNACNYSVCQSTCAIIDEKMQFVGCNKDNTQLSSPLSDENKSPFKFEDQTDNSVSESIKLAGQTGICISESMSLSACVKDSTEFHHTLSDSNIVTAEELHISQNGNNVEKVYEIGRNFVLSEDQGISGDVGYLHMPDVSTDQKPVLFFQEYDRTIVDDCVEIDEDEQETMMLDEELLNEVIPLPVKENIETHFTAVRKQDTEKDSDVIPSPVKENIETHFTAVRKQDTEKDSDVIPLTHVTGKDKLLSPVRKQDTEKVVEVIPLTHVAGKDKLLSPVRKQDAEKVVEVTSPKLSLKRNRPEKSPDIEDAKHVTENAENSAKKMKLEQPIELDTESSKEEQLSDSVKAEWKNRNSFNELMEFSKLMMEKEKTPETEKNKIVSKMKQQLDSTQLSHIRSEEFSSFLDKSFKRIKEDSNLVFNVLCDLKNELKKHKFKSKVTPKANNRTNIDTDYTTSVSTSSIIITDDSQSVDSLFSLQSNNFKTNQNFNNHISEKIQEFYNVSTATNSTSDSALNNVSSKKCLNFGDEDINLISSPDNSSSAFPQTVLGNKFGSSEIAAKLGLIPTGSVSSQPSDSISNTAETKYDRSLDPITTHQESKFSYLKNDKIENNADSSFISSKNYNAFTSVSSKHSGFKQDKVEKKQDLSPVASTSGYHSSASESSKPSGIGEDSVKHNPRMAMRIKKLEKALADLDKAIKKCQKRELSLNDLDNADSAYIKESKYKQRFIKVYNKLCELTKSPRRTGRITEKRFKYEGSRYKAINEAIQKLVNKKKVEKFPDYSEVYKTVQQVNDRLDMGLSERDVETESERVFKDVGIALQERRCRDDAELFGCYLTDDLKPEEDPAERDEQLRKTLAENSKKFESSISELIDKYVEKQKANPEEGVSDKGSEEEEEEDDEKEEEDQDDNDDDKVKDVNMEEDDLPTNMEDDIPANIQEDDLPSTNPNSPVLSDGIPADLIRNDFSDDDIIILDHSDKSTDPNDEIEKEKLGKPVIADSIVIEDSNDSDELPSVDDIIGR